MSNQFFIPFNFEPADTFVQGTTYNLPAGNYARIIPTDFKEDIVIDGDVVLEQLVCNDESSQTSTSFSSVAVPTGIGSLASRASFSIHGTSGSTCLYEVRDNNGAVIFSGSTVSATYVVEETEIAWLDGYQMFIRTDNGANAAFVSLNIAPVNTPSQHFWASGGVSGITITGDRFTVELYNSIT